jgi:mRNA interferase HigB
MRVISKPRLKRFWETPGRESAQGPLQAWHTHVKNKSIAWHSWGDVKAEFGNAGAVGNCVVFNIGGNKYRLVTRILYRSQKVSLLKVMTHAEYDKHKWKVECGCVTPPPDRKDTLRETARQPQRKGGQKW